MPTRSAAGHPVSKLSRRHRAAARSSSKIARTVTGSPHERDAEPHSHVPDQLHASHRGGQLAEHVSARRAITRPPLRPARVPHAEPGVIVCSAISNLLSGLITPVCLYGAGASFQKSPPRFTAFVATPGVELGPPTEQVRKLSASPSTARGATKEEEPRGRRSPGSAYRAAHD